MLDNKTVPCLLLTLGISAAVFAADWPQWRGPERTDISSESGVLKKWPAAGPKRLWLFDQAGLGYSGFSIVGKRLFTIGARDDVEYVIAIDVETGKELWSTRVGPMLTNGWGDGPRGTPTVDGELVYALGGKGYLVCLGAADGKEVWRCAMSDFGGKVPGWGYAESVLVDGPHVVCTPGGRRGAMVALDKATGQLSWQAKEFTDGAQYSSIIVAEHGGTRQYIQLTMKSVVGVRAEDGELLWRSDWPGRTAVIPTPIFHDGRVFITSGYGVGCRLMKLGDDSTSVEELWSNRNMKNHHGGVVLLDGHLYGFSDDMGWVCQSFESGDIVWREKGELGKGAIAYSDGRFYCLEERSGTVVLIEASTEGWSEQGRFTLSPQTKRRSPRGRVWTHPVIANGKLYLRDQEYIYCYDVKE